MDDDQNFEELAEGLLSGPLAAVKPRDPSEDLPIEAELYSALAKHYGPSTAEAMRRIIRRRIALDIDTRVPLTAAGSHVGGHPFVPVGEDFQWPLNPDSGAPMTFLIQVNFAELPALEGFPTEGLLQWWIRGDDDTYGLFLDGNAPSPREGMLLKFYSAEDLARGSQFEATDEIPNYTYEEDPEGGEGSLGPLYQKRPFALVPREAPSLFLYGEEATVDQDVLDFVGELTEEAESEETIDRKFIELLAGETQIGGYPNFVQGDPRHSDSEDLPRTLILQVESMRTEDREEVSMWGDMGNAQLFGDLEALRRGDTSEFWWDWACG